MPGKVKTVFRGAEGIKGAYQEVQEAGRRKKHWFKMQRRFKPSAGERAKEFHLRRIFFSSQDAESKARYFRNTDVRYRIIHPENSSIYVIYTEYPLA